eukprot:scaffold6059_cov103-Isochrysis_galbana.AAC.3
MSRGGGESGYRSAALPALAKACPRTSMMFRAKAHRPLNTRGGRSSVSRDSASGGALRSEKWLSLIRMKSLSGAPTPGVAFWWAWAPVCWAREACRSAKSMWKARERMAAACEDGLHRGEAVHLSREGGGGGKGASGNGVEWCECGRGEEKAAGWPFSRVDVRSKRAAPSHEHNG